MKFLSCNTLTGPLVTPTASNCTTLLLQASRLGLQKIPVAAAPFADQPAAMLKASWDTQMALSTDAKIVVPKFKHFAPELPPTEAVKKGSNDNSTPNGRSIVMGQTIPMFKAQWNGLNPTQYSQAEDLMNWGNANVDFDSLGVYFFLGTRQVLMSKDFGPIPAHAFFIGDPTGMQLHELTMFPIEFELDKGWFRDTIVFDLGFNHNLL
ncbi:hypothetical protein [Spirosoma spitsbergense]|uniref:hypothetical protein n=1 Tax=Spirosoma spitsbergense TaxID=431554 RepID=UPI00037776DD|nr:hypothetical protein [Spirosoma spitsbergense]